MTQLALVYDRINQTDAQRAMKLTGDLLKVFHVMLDHKPHTVRDLASILHLPETSVSAHLRHLRKPKFGAFNVQRKSLTKGSSYYILIK